MTKKKKKRKKLAQAFLDTKQGRGAVVKVLDSLSQKFCWWFTWLDQFVNALLRINLWYQSTGVYVFLTHEIIHEEFSAINTSFMETNVLKSIFVCHFVIVSCKDNKLISKYQSGVLFWVVMEILVLASTLNNKRPVRNRK